MSGNTKIEWATRIWNPVTGCSPVGEGCRNCYAERMSQRIKGRFGYPSETPFQVTLHPERLDEPFHWKKPGRAFVCSMGDLFHDDVPDKFIHQVLFPLYTLTNQTFIFLTKRPARMKAFLGKKPPLGPNVWGGISIWDQDSADAAIPVLLQTNLTIRIVSYEPGLGPVDLSGYLRQGGCHTFPDGEAMPRLCLWEGRKGSVLNDPCQGWPPLDWVICGGESGPGARPMHPDWPRSMRDQCQAAEVPFFFKQWGEWKPWEPGDCGTVIHISERDGATGGQPGYVDVPKKPFGVEPRCDTRPMARVGKKAASCLLDGREWKEFPEVRL